MKKTIYIIGLCFLVILMIAGIYMAMPSKTLDFRGTVTEIETVDNDTVFHISTTETSYIVAANSKTKVTYCCKDDPDIDLADIKVGDTIEGNYRWLSKDNKAKFITVWYDLNPDITELQERYPQFFNVSTEGGLAVYVWQMAKNNYHCYLVNSAAEASADNSFAYEAGATIAEMRAILTTYPIDRTEITIQPVINPLSSYYYEIDDTYRARIRELFWKE